MKKISLQLNFEEAQMASELSLEEQKLLKLAKEAAAKAYAPYSHFHVGAAVLLENGVIVSGNNQENAAYPSSLCAERVALFAASAQYPSVAIKALAVTAKSNKSLINQAVTPCGACRQVMIEYEKLGGKDLKVIMQGEEGPILITTTVRNLIPMSFDGNHLKEE